jgi:hypothetical protein
VVPRAEIEGAGVFRLGELVRLARRWDAVTVDEYTWRAAAASLAPLEEDGWTVTLDGHEVDPSLLGVLALERLPVELAALDSVVFTSAPALAAGRIRPAGVIELHTARPRQGLLVRARYATGSETGDPGPFAFLPGAVPNRDRFGHDASIGVEYGGRRWHAAAGLGLGVHVATDPAVADRLLATGAFPRIGRTAPSVRAGLTSERGEHHLLAGRTEIDDWFRLEAYGVEIPARSTLDHAGVDGAFSGPGARGARFEYRAGYERAAISSLPFAPRLALESRVFRAELAVAGTAAEHARRAGVGIVHRDIEGPGTRSVPSALEIRVFGSAGWSIGPPHRQTLVLSAGVVDGEIAAGVALAHRWRAAPGDEVAVMLAVSRTPREGTGLWTLAARGDSWLGDVGVASSIDSEDPRAPQASADVAWSHRASRRLMISTALYYRASRSGYLARRDLAFDPGRFAWRGPVAVTGGLPGQVGGLAGGAELALGPRATVRGWYRLRTVLSGGDMLRDAWSATPAHAGALEASYSPASGFELFGRAAVRGAIDRADYQGTAELAEVGARTGASVTADLGVQKWFWRKRIRAHVGARNLFDGRSVTHPEGGGTGRAFLLGAQAGLP